MCGDEPASAILAIGVRWALRIAIAVAPWAGRRLVSGGNLVEGEQVERWDGITEPG